VQLNSYDWCCTPDDDPVKGSKHVASLVKCNKANVDAVVSSLFEFNWCCVDGIFPI
jgi:hypothetical protein